MNFKFVATRFGPIIGEYRHSLIAFRTVRRYSTKNGIFKATSKNYEKIEDFYKGKSIFLTGGTGFLGKVFIERLLYKCAGLEKIYLLIRCNQGNDIQTRLRNIFESPLFTKLRQKNPEFTDKVVPINGDITLPNLGISSEDEEILLKKVSVVIHSAATIRFLDPLATVMNINVGGTQRVLDLCKRIHNIEAFVHISTAYVQSQQLELSEKVYPPLAKLENIYEFIEKYGDDKEELRKFLNGCPNVYEFTKSLAESYVAENHGHVPTVILRPSMVTPTIKEPTNGWLDNWFGATRVLYHTSQGWNRITYGKSHHVADFIPIDYVANLTIIAAARAQKSKEVQVYHSTSSGINPVKWHDVYTTVLEESVKKGYNKKSFNFMLYSESRILVNIITLILQTLPAYIADFSRKARGESPKHDKIMSKVVELRDSVDYYTSHTWTFKADKSRELYYQLSKEDQQKFPCDPKDINWNQYIKDYLNAIYRNLKYN